MKKSILTFATLFCFIGFIKAQPQWMQTTTPPGGSVWALATIGTKLFAGTASGGVYLSTNNGATWVQRNGAYPNMQVRSLVANGTVLYAGTGGSFGGGIYKSSNDGVTWTNITPTGMNTSTNVFSLVRNGTYIFAGTYGGGGIYKSLLSGINSGSWTAFNTGLVNQNIRSLAFKGASIVAGSYGDGIWISPIGSPGWTSTSSGMGGSSDYVQSLLFNGPVVFAGNISGLPVLYRSLNSGSTWTTSSTSVFANKPVYALTFRNTSSCFGVNGNTYYAGTEGGGIFMSTDVGVNWTAFNQGFQNCGLNIRSFAFIGNNFFAGTDCGVWKRECTCNAGANQRFYNNSTFLNSSIFQLIDFSTNYDGTPMSNPADQHGLTNWNWNGLSFSNCSSYWNSYIMTSAGIYITVDFPPGLYKKVGFDMSEFSGGAPGVFTIKVTSGECVYTYQQAGAAGTSYFFGIKLPTAIDKIEVMRNTGILTIDNFRVGN